MSKPPLHSAPFMDAVDEIMRLYRSLPHRPSIEEVEAAMVVAQSADADLEVKIRSLDNMERAQDVPEELFYVVTEVRRNMALLQCYDQKREAAHVVETERRMRVFDRLIQRASRLVTSVAVEEDLTDDDDRLVVSGLEFGIGDGRSLSLEKNKKKKKTVGEMAGSTTDSKELLRSSSLKGVALEGYHFSVSGEQAEEAHKLTLIKIAGIIEKCSKSGAAVLDLQGKLMDDIEWLPVSLGKLSDLTDLNLSENRLMALPSTIGGLRFLSKLDLNSNRLTALPDSFGGLTSLVDLDLHCNFLQILPASIGNLTRLTNLDLSSNQLTILPDSLGNLTQLRTLIVETNDLEELPYTIGSCSSLAELRLDFNQLRALPEAVGKLESMEILTAHYNRIKSLPTTMASLTKLEELDVSFNEVESIPESLCLVTSLLRLNIGNNFADLRYLPRSIGNLEMLEELNISNNQITMLPESFKMLSKLRVFYSDESPLEVPPREVTKLGAKAVVRYMADLGAPKEPQAPQSGEKNGGGFFSRLCSIMRHCGQQRSTREEASPRQVPAATS